MAETDIMNDDFAIDSDTIEPDQPSQSTQPLQPPPQYGVLPDGQRMEQRRFTGGDTLDEPVTATLMRDVRSFYHLLLLIVGWNAKESVQSREWDLWGPLVFTLLISTVLSLLRNVHSDDFASIFSILWLGQAMIAVNTRSLGGSITFLHTMVITGYSLFPLLLAAICSLALSIKFIRVPIDIVLVAWATWSASRGLKFVSMPDSRRALAVIPVGIFYAYIGWICVIAG